MGGFCSKGEETGDVNPEIEMNKEQDEKGDVNPEIEMNKEQDEKGDVNPEIEMNKEQEQDDKWLSQHAPRRNKDAVGVSASVLIKLAKLVKDGWTTKDVCQHLIKPLTAKHDCVFVDLLGGQTDGKGRPYLGIPTLFLSHAWKYRFSVPLSVMLKHAEENPDAYFWFDLFVNDQNNAHNLPQEFWTETFQRNIESIGKVILVLHPWHDPVPLQRAWCLYEILMSFKSDGVELRIELPPDEEASFQEALTKDYKSAMDALVRTRAENSEAFNPDDKEMIFETVRNTIGFSQLNEQVKDQMREWFLGMGLDVARKQEEEGHGKEWDLEGCV